MKYDKDEQTYYSIGMIVFILTLFIMFAFGEKSIFYLLFSGIAISTLYQLWFLVKKNKIWFFNAFFRPSKFIKKFVLIADIIILTICFIIVTIFIKFKFF